MADKYIIHTDGGSRGNPGPAALGVVIESADGSLHRAYGEYLGEQTNNFAEYSAVVSGLKKLRQLIGKDKAKAAEVEVFADSELMVRQMNGAYKISDPTIQKFFVEIWNLMIDYGHVTFRHVRREFNKEADTMVNQALDRELGNTKLF